MLKKFFLLLFLGPLLAGAQDIDVQHYTFSIRLFDSTDRIEGDALLDIRFPGGNRSFAIDLVGKKANGKGMTVQQVNGYQVASWKQEGDKVVVQLNEGINDRDTYHFQVKYSGIPADGLIISKNKWGDRTFFADNWPNRAHHWIPCNDRPDDKATFGFQVYAPEGYQVVSNGLAAVMATTGLPQDPKRPRPGMPTAVWRESVPSSTKVMVIGVARFAVKLFDDSPRNIPVTAWVFPQDSAKGFYDYALAPSILKFFSEYIAPFPYEKLANVQSKTIFGGMENASAIFYAEESVTGDRKWEDVIAHEIAHQWFGDMASEKSFAHLWLSEGFATYMTNLYIEQKYGADSMRKRLQADRAQVIGFAYGWNHGVVDSTANLMSLLNANSYQKGGWVLHMLRQEVGDDVFRATIQAYYNTYKGGNAETRDLERIADSVYHARSIVIRSDFSMRRFFDQWLYRPGVPILGFDSKVKDGEVKVTITQRGPLYALPLEIGLVDATGKMTVETIQIEQKETEFKWALPGTAVVRVVVDPNSNLLYQDASAVSWKTVRQKRE